jgi:hypothetical protein
MCRNNPVTLKDPDGLKPEDEPPPVPVRPPETFKRNTPSVPVRLAGRMRENYWPQGFKGAQEVAGKHITASGYARHTAWKIDEYYYDNQGRVKETKAMQPVIPLKIPVKLYERYSHISHRIIQQRPAEHVRIYTLEKNTSNVYYRMNIHIGICEK